MIPKAVLAGMIPHAGTMCLLDGVIQWDASSIRCVASSHRDPQNPLAIDGTLGAVCGAEYAAQAMAVHGGLAGVVGERPKSGYLMSLRALGLHRERLDDLAGDLVIDAERLTGEGFQIVYRFAVACEEKLILDGRAAVLLADRPPS